MGAYGMLAPAMLTLWWMVLTFLSSIFPGFFGLGTLVITIAGGFHPFFGNFSHNVDPKGKIFSAREPMGPVWCL